MTNVKTVTIGDLRGLMAPSSTAWAVSRRLKYAMNCDELVWEHGALNWLLDQLTHPERGGLLSEPARQAIDEKMLAELILFDCEGFKKPSVLRTQLATTYWGECAGLLLGHQDSLLSVDTNGHAHAVLKLILNRVARLGTLARLDVLDYGELTGYTAESQYLSDYQSIFDVAKMRPGDELFLRRLMNSLHASTFKSAALDTTLESWGTVTRFDLLDLLDRAPASAVK